MMAIGVGIGTLVDGFGFGLLFALLGTPALLWILGNLIRNGVIRGENTILGMPLVGWIYERVFAPPTFYAMDTAIMFQEAVHRAVLEVVDNMTAGKGIRALTESERKPVMKLAARA